MHDSYKAFDTDIPELRKKGFDINYKWLTIYGYWRIIVINTNTQEAVVAVKHYKKLIEGVEAAIKLAYLWQEGKLPQTAVVQKIHA